MTTAPLWIGADEIAARVSVDRAVRTVQRELRNGLDPDADFERRILEVAAGQLLIMPAHSAQFVGTKLATVAPGNPARGRERIQGIYVLMDAETLGPVALLDGTALTSLRTPAISAAAADALAPRTVRNLVVFGAGPQASGHIEAMRGIRAIGSVTIVSRDAARAARLARSVTDSGLPAAVGTPADVRHADLIVCATTSRTPLFDGGLVRADSCTIAVGSHESDARELDSALVSRSQVVVETRQVALREAGDILIPLAEGAIAAEDLVPLRDIVTGEVEADPGRPRVFTSSGMPWEDLVIAAEVYRRS